MDCVRMEYKIYLQKEDEEITTISLSQGRKKRKCVLKKRSYVYADSADSEDEFEVEDARESIQTETVTQSDKTAFIYHVKMANPNMMMKKIVNHPFTIHYPIHPGTKNVVLSEDIVTQCGKMMVLDAMLTKLKERGHKVKIHLIFGVLFSYNKQKYKSLQFPLNLQLNRRSFYFDN